MAPYRLAPAHAVSVLGNVVTMMKNYFIGINTDLALSTAFRHSHDKQQAGLSQVALPRAWHFPVGWPLGFLCVTRNRNLSLVQSDAQIEWVKVEAMKNGVGRGKQRAKAKGAGKAINDGDGQYN